MASDIASKLKSPDARQTKSDILLANYIERNLSDLAFETAKSIAVSVGVSQMTVGRYLRRLGYDGLDELKREIRESSGRTAWSVKGKFDRLREDARDGKLSATLIHQQIDDLGRVYEMTQSPQWRQACELLVNCKEVFVAAFQNVRGVGQFFASQLSYARPNVQFTDGLNGTYLEILDGASDDRCLFLYDVRRFASKARPLAMEARQAGVKVILLSDDTCVWADEVADVALIMPGARGPLWDGAALPVAVLDLIIASVVVELGDAVNARVDRLTKLQDAFGDFE